MSDADRFKSPRPAFVAPNDSGLLTPKPQDHHIPAPSVIERATNEGNDKIASLLEKAKASAKEQAKVIEAKKSGTPRKKSKKEEEEKGTTSAPVEVDPAYVVDDAEFVKRTRSGDRVNIHDPELKALFYANGGERHLNAGLTYGQAFENLRREKLNALLKSNGPAGPYRRVNPLPSGTKVHVPGMPTKAEMYAKASAEADAKRRRENENFIGFVKPPKR